MTAASETDQVFAALLAAQKEFLHITKEGTVPLTKAGLSGATAKFATFPDVIEHVRPILNKHGLALSQPVKPAQGGVCVITRVLHESGQSYGDEGTFIPAAKHDPMGYGSAMSYAKRYGVLSLLGVATDDDDGAAALAGFEREKRAEAQAAARAASTIDEREVGILCAIGKAVSPQTTDERLLGRYSDILTDDFDKTLQAGLGVAVKQQAITQEQADAVADAVLTGATVDEVRELLTSEVAA